MKAARLRIDPPACTCSARWLVALTAARSSRASPSWLAVTAGIAGAQVVEQVLVEEAVAEPGERAALVAQDVHRGDGL